MSTLDQNEDGQAGQEQSAPQVTEISVLKDRARMMGITFSNNIGVDSLREKINAVMNGAEDTIIDKAAPVTEPVAEVKPNPLAGEVAGKPLKKKSLRQHLFDEQMKLVRVRITCMDPKKKDLPGEILTVANEHLGTVRKYVPYGEQTDEGFHIPFILYTMMDARKFLNIRTIKDRRTGSLRVDSAWAKEFALDVLPDLTRADLARLAAAQAAAGSIDSVQH